MRKNLKSIILLLAILCVLLSGCSPTADGENKDGVSSTTTDSVVDYSSPYDSTSTTAGSVGNSESVADIKGGSKTTENTNRSNSTVSKDASQKSETDVTESSRTQDTTEKTSQANTEKNTATSNGANNENVSVTDKTISTESDDKTEEIDPTTSTNMTIKTDAEGGIILPDDEW